MKSSPKSGEENTFIKAYEELEKTTRVVLRDSEAFPLIEIVHGPRQGAWFSLAPHKEVSIGRAPNNTIILEDNSVSRSHAMLQLTNQGYLLRDIGSRNGTFLNSKKIQGEVPVQHCDLIKIGIYTLRFLEEPAEAEAPVLEETRVEVPPKKGLDENRYLNKEELLEKEEAEGPSKKLAETALMPRSSVEEKPLPSAVPPSDQVPVPVEVGGSSPGRKNLQIFGIAILLLVVGIYSAYRLGAFDRLRDAMTGKKVAQTQKTEVAPSVAKTAPQGQMVNALLEVSATPISAKIFFQGKELGVTPFKVNIQAPLNTPQEILAEFMLDGIQEKWIEKRPLQVQRAESLIPIRVDGSLGEMTVTALPPNAQLFLQGKYLQDQGELPLKRLTNVSINTPIMLPFGKYTAEVRQMVSTDGVRPAGISVKYRREFELSANARTILLQVNEEELKYFPATLTTNPPGAEVWLDGKKLGETPYAGNIPVGRHQISIRKEGFSPLDKELSIELNTPYVANFNLITTPAGEFLNKAKQFIKDGKYNEGIEQLAEALRQNPEATEQAQINMLLGESFLKTQSYDQAIAYYQRAKSNPEFEKFAELGIAEASLGLGQKDQALIKLLNVYLNTNDPKIRSAAENLYAKISPMKSVLYIATEPVGATVSINGNPIGQGTPVILSDLFVGSYRVNIQKEGYKPFETRVTLTLAAIKPIIVNLEAQP
jgi:pSer/pThr/pTyr-binding forkhead associated (FHA) protein/tetratricopeptide (TPR) repeat protein